MKTERVSIETEYITLGQLLKLADLIDTGGHAKVFLQEEQVLVNGEQTAGRGKKIFPGDFIKIVGQDLILEIVSESQSPKE